jgi:hypothetical protein
MPERMSRRGSTVFNQCLEVALPVSG